MSHRITPLLIITVIIVNVYKEKASTLLWRLVLALPIFTGSEPTTAGGRYRKASEWQGSAGNEPALSGDVSAGVPQQGTRPATIVGTNELNFCVRDGVRWERRLWRKKRPERVAAVGKDRARLAGDGTAGHRNRKQVEPVPYNEKEPGLSLTLLLCWHYLFSRPVARQLSSAQMSLTSVFGMGTGGPSS